MMTRCPRFDRCSASVCPLDPEWPTRRYRREDRTCAWLLEAAKADGEATIRGALPTELAEEVLRTLPAVVARYAPLRRRLETASAQGSKVRSARALREVGA